MTNNGLFKERYENAGRRPRRNRRREANNMVEYTDERMTYNNLVSLLQSIEERTAGNENKDKYIEAVETFLSYMQESPKTMLQKVKGAKSLKTREELRERTVREAIRYLDTIAEREEVSIREYSFRSAVVGEFIRLLGNYVVRGT
jgi:hypothetical protein